MRMRSSLQLCVFLSTLGAVCASAAQVPEPMVVQSRERLDQGPEIRPRVPVRPLAVEALAKTGLPPSERITLPPKYPVEKPVRTEHHEGLRRDVVVVKFVDGARVRMLRSDRPRARVREEDPRGRLSGLRPEMEKLDDYDRALLRREDLTREKLEREMAEVRIILGSAPLREWSPVFSLDPQLLEALRLNAEIRKGRQSSDLANYYAFRLAEGHPGELLADRLNQLDVVELAYLAPIPEDADIPPATPSFEGRQDYLDPAPGGIDARYAWTQPGGDGSLVRIVDVEMGWNLGHEDLPSMFIADGNIQTDDSRQHGTAVMGVMVGLDDGIGITGIVPRAAGGVVSADRGLGLAYRQNVADAVLIGVLNLAVGDVILIEQHARGPGRDRDCTLCPRVDGKARESCGYIAMEYWNAIFDAINVATAAGVIVVEAAGNGEMDLDHSRYKDRFNRIVRNSGALMVGAGSSDTREPLCFTNHGSRLDVQGWGEDVMTAGYGSSPDLMIDGADDNQWYTSSFGGTSSATPIVAGAVAAIQGIQIANNNPVKDWAEIADLLISTGTPQGGSRQIGPLPDLAAAIGRQVSEEPPSPDDALYEYEVTLSGDLLDSDRTVSGFTGDRTRVLGIPAERGAIERLKLGERSDRPCYVRAEKADIVDHTIVTPHEDLDLCGGQGPTDRSLDYVPLLTTSHDTFVRGVSVCNSKTSNSSRLKGVKLYRTRIEDDGSLSQISNPTTFDRPNCDGNWRTPAMCPAGSVATKLVVHIRDEGNHEVVTGLALRCKQVEVERTCVSGCGGAVR